MTSALQQLDQLTAELRWKVSELEAAHRRREEFLAMIAHDLGGVLTAVAGYATLLESRDVPPAVQERARAVICAQARRMARLVEDLVDGTQAAAGRFCTRPRLCDLVEIAREQVELAHGRTDRHTIRLEAPRRAVPALCDPDRMAQVVGNLLTNAITHTPGGEIRVRVWAEDGQPRLSVSDQGPGIPPDQLEVIFEPRVRLDPDSAGAGLGLYIVRGIVAAHDGRVWAESPVGRGATFNVCLRPPVGPAATGTTRIASRRALTTASAAPPRCQPFLAPAGRKGL